MHEAGAPCVVVCHEDLSMRVFRVGADARVVCEDVFLWGCDEATLVIPV